MNKEKIGKELKAELIRGYSITRISRWAFRVFSENIRSLDPSLRDILESIFAMEADPQFEMTFDELNDLADRLIFEGEREELFNPIPEIKETAEYLVDNWLMCPLCRESWENHSKYGMVRCPKCGNKLHNPQFKAL